MIPYLPFSCPQFFHSSFQPNLGKEEIVHICYFPSFPKESSSYYNAISASTIPKIPAMVANDFHKGESNGNFSILIKLKVLSAFSRIDGLLSTQNYSLIFAELRIKYRKFQNDLGISM